jgi:glutathione S-transferase
VLWALRELNLSFELVPTSTRLGPDSELLVSFSGRQPFGEPEGFRKLAGPAGAIPVLVEHSGFAVWESNTIVEGR